MSIEIIVKIRNEEKRLQKDFLIYDHPIENDQEIRNLVAETRKEFNGDIDHIDVIVKMNIQ